MRSRVALFALALGLSISSWAPLPAALAQPSAVSVPRTALPGCKINQNCSLPPGTTVSVGASVRYVHKALFIPSDSTIECLADFCRLEFELANLTLLGTVRGPMIKVETYSLHIVGGHLNADGLGHHPGTGPGAGRSALSGSGSGAGYGGVGHSGCAVRDPAGGGIYGSSSAVVDYLGSGGGDALTATGSVLNAGGRGGGVVQVEAQLIKFEAGAQLTSNGKNGGQTPFINQGGGGGSGGTIIVRGVNFEHDPAGGTVEANGGSGAFEGVSPAGTGGGGGGGRIFVTSPKANIPPTINTRAKAGSSDCGAGGTGSVTLWEGRRLCVKKDGATNFTCTCEAGFAGSLCDVCTVDRFGANCEFQCPDCGAHGDCSKSSSGAPCTCHSGWEGSKCDRCAPLIYGNNCQNLCVPCGSHADCDDGRTGDGSCQCHDGWGGEDCATCAPGRYGPSCKSICPLCGNFGACDQGRNGTGVCKCNPGWGGALCDTCVPGSFGGSCDQTCGDCGINGHCDDGPGGRGCVCDATWRRANVTAGANLCTECIPNHWGPTCLACDKCGDHGKCVDGVAGNGRCQCDPGWFGVNCENQCPACSINGECDDGRTGSGLCVCKTGWGGKLCTECAPGWFGPACTQKCAAPCGLNSECDGGFSGKGCTCSKNWRPPYVGAPNCTVCAPGYYGPTCAACPPCGVWGQCNDGLTGNGRCTCDSGHFGNLCNQTCPDCGTGTCQDGRLGSGRCTCVLPFAGSNCQNCAPGYYGPTCASQCGACGLNGVCDDGRAGQGCKCAQNWTTSGIIGSANATCDTCVKGHYGGSCKACPDCGAHGTCNDGRSNDGRCKCDAGWTGARCDKCASGFFGPSCSGTCPNCGTRRTCDQGVNGRGVCLCTGGWTGTDCDRCSEGWGGPQCDTCLPGFYGPACQKCQCEQSGTGSCDDGLTGTGACTCKSKFAGTMCKACAPLHWGATCTTCNCGAGATCDETISGDGECSCLNGFQGSDCTLLTTAAYCEPPLPVYDGAGKLISGVADTKSWLPPSGKCLPGVTELSTGLDLSTGKAAVTPVFAMGWRKGVVATLDAGTFSRPVGVSVNTRSGRLVTSAASLMGSAADMQTYQLHHRMGVEPGTDAEFPPSVLARSASLRSSVDLLAQSRFSASVQHRIELATLSVATVPTAGPGLNGHAASGSVEVTRRFRADVAALPRDASASGAAKQYRDFVRRYGTHYPKAVTIGGRLELTATAVLCGSFSVLAADGDQLNQIETALVGGGGSGSTSAAGSGSGAGAAAAKPAATFTGLTAKVLAKGGQLGVSPGVDGWEATVAGAPSVVGYKLGQIHELVDDTTIRDNVEAAAAAYLDEASLANQQVVSPSTTGAGNASAMCGYVPPTVSGNAATAPGASGLLAALVSLAAALAVAAGDHRH